MTLETGEGGKRSHILALSAKGARGRSWPSGGGSVDLFSRTQAAQALPSSQLRETRSLRISLGTQPRLLLSACPLNTSHIQAWDPWGCCPESRHLAFVHGSGGSPTQRVASPAPGSSSTCPSISQAPRPSTSQCMAPLHL